MEATCTRCVECRRCWLAGWASQRRPSDFGFSTCCVTNEGIGTDSKTGTAFATYASTVTRHNGLYAQRLTAAGKRSGAAILLPRSNVGLPKARYVG